jgi:hypothetical protein
MLALWFLLFVALAGPHREKPPSSSRINAGTAEPVRVSPPEAVAYPLELAIFGQVCFAGHHLLLPLMTAILDLGQLGKVVEIIVPMILTPLERRNLCTQPHAMPCSLCASCSAWS